MHSEVLGNDRREAFTWDVHFEVSVQQEVHATSVSEVVIKLRLRLGC